MHPELHANRAGVANDVICTLMLAKTYETLKAWPHLKTGSIIQSVSVRQYAAQPS